MHEQFGLFLRGTSGLNKLVFVFNPSHFVSQHCENYMIFREGTFFLKEVICETQSVEVQLFIAATSS